MNNVIYKRIYRPLIFLPIFFFLLAACFLIYNQAKTGEFVRKSVELSGGNQLSIQTERQVDVTELETFLEKKVGDVSVRSTTGIGGYGLLIRTTGVDQAELLDLIQEYGISTRDFSWQEIGPQLGSSFWKQSRLALILAFMFMAFVVLVYFKNFVPSVAVIFAAGSDIICTLAVMQIFGIELSLASFAGLLLVLGYSIDTNILLTTRLLKGSGKIERRIKRALKTGLTMTTTTLCALTALFLLTQAPVLLEIAAVLIIALLIDLPNTWLTNCGVLRWWMERKGLI